jgi:2-polyprenyl-6-methoxyphenol hydroxylase-like FAD-dependent oxidoreductase
MMSTTSSDVIVVGGGPAGAVTAMLLADQGVDVTVLDRDTGELPSGAAEAWADWRRSVAQFRMAHALLPLGHRLLAEHCPSVVAELDRLGGRTVDVLSHVPARLGIDGDRRPGDERFVTVTARRPVLELAFSRALNAHPRVTVERGVEVASLLAETTSSGVQIRGVRTVDHGDRPAAVVIDASGRRSPLPRWLEAVGARPPAVDSADEGFVYYGRFFRQGPDGLPPLEWMLRPAGSISLLVLPDEAGWSVTVYTSSKDMELRALRDVDAWERVVGAHPSHAAFLDGEPDSAGVSVMTSHVGRRRSLLVDGAPVASGIVAVGDSWACTNPSLGRGISLGILHAVHTAEVVHRHLDDPPKVTAAWQEETDRELGPWYDATVELDRVRLEEVEAHRTGRDYLPEDPVAQLSTLMRNGANHDPEVARMYAELLCCLALPLEVIARDGAWEAVASAGAHGPLDPPRPSRDELVALARGSAA